MQLRKISRGRVRSVGVLGGLFWVRRVWRRVNISLSGRKNARHPYEILSPSFFDNMRGVPRATQHFPLF